MNANNNTRNKIIKDIMNLEKDVRFIPMHRESQDELESWEDGKLARWHRMLVELKNNQ